MFPEQLKKILNLIKKTRDRVVIFDASAPDESYVVMDFDNYANLADPQATPEQPGPTIPPVASSLESKPEKAEAEVNLAVKSDLTEEDLTDKINREISMWKNGESSPFLAEESKPRPAWKIPPQVKEKAQEVQE